MRQVARAQPWGPADATDAIRELANGYHDYMRTKHAQEQMIARGLINGDILHVLKKGFVYETPEPSTRDGFYKYRMEATTPNSSPRALRVVVIPCQNKRLLKVVTIMWVDEVTTGNSN